MNPAIFYVLLNAEFVLCVVDIGCNLVEHDNLHVLFNTDQGSQFTSEVFSRTVIDKVGASFPWTAKAELLITCSSNDSGAV